MTNIKAMCAGQVLALCHEDRIILYEGRAYFPADTVTMNFLQRQSPPLTQQVDNIGLCHFYDLNINGNIIASACWTSLFPITAAYSIRGYFAFTNNVQIYEE